MGRELKLDQQKANDLKRLAAERLNANLVSYGNEPTSDQRTALDEIISHYVDIGIGEISGRYAFALPTGLGKTQSIIAFISALSELGYDDISVAVCTSKIEALCDLKRALERQGVSPDSIGLVHSYKYEDSIAKAYLSGEHELPPLYASLPSTDVNTIGGRQFLLLTHQRVKGKYGIDRFNVYKGQPRDLFIWDESLIVSDTFTFDADEMDASLAFFETREKGRTEVRQEAVIYLREGIDMIKTEIRRQQEGRHENVKPRVIRFSPLESHEIGDYKDSLGEEEVAEPLKGLLDVSQESLRVLTNVEQRGGVLTYNLVVPKELTNMVILDASHNIRELANMDDTIKAVDLNKDLVSYENVTVNQLRYPSGRASMKKEFKKRSRQRKITKEIASVIKSIPDNEGILIFVFKEKFDVDYKDILLKDLRKYGIDTEKQIKVTIGDSVCLKPRFVILTWGNETSLSQHSYCCNVILAGVLHRSHLDIGSAIVGQKQDLTMPLNSRDIRRVLQSEVVHCVYQAMSRGSCRVIVGSKTKPMNVWLIHSRDIRHLISEVMPALNWRDWEGRYLKPIVEPKTKPLSVTISEQIDQYTLKGLAKVSIKRLKQDLRVTDIAPRTFFRALDMSLKNTDWERIGRSIERTFVLLFGNRQEDSLKSYLVCT